MAMGNLPRRDDGASRFLARDFNRNVKIHFLAPGEHRGCDRQRRKNSLGGRRIEEFCVQRDRSEFKTDVRHRISRCLVD